MTSANPITTDNGATTPNDPANFYDPDKNAYLLLKIGSDANSHGTLEHFTKISLFLLNPPDFLSDKDKSEYSSKMARLQRYSAHRINYLHENGKQVKGSDKLLQDWNEQTVGGKEKHEKYNAWLTQWCHDKRDLKKLLGKGGTGTGAEGSAAGSGVENEEG